MTTERRIWGSEADDIQYWLRRGAFLAIAAVWLVAGYLHSRDWNPLALLGIVVIGSLTSRTPRRIEIDGDTVTFVLPVRRIQVPATGIHRLRRTRLAGNVMVETSAGKFRIPFWLKGLQALALHMWTLNPALVIDGP